ncbi:hypothetical protein WA026_018517 [Henosepilachna vigintioctopunctata]|uniref:Chemosensory protein n=1 Tax=Henosepilachna vigintioctopunctata TaxID=420089 RepID=A0AAW1UBH0_9CUCU
MKFELLVLALVCFLSVCGDDKYTSKYNNIDLEAIMHNDRLLKNYFKCLTEGTGCTPEGSELRKILPDAVKTGCAKCTDEHKAAAKKFVSFLMKEKPQMWEKLVQHYDPDKTYRNKYKDLLKDAGFDV